MAAIHSDEFKRDTVRIALTSGLTRRQVASDLGIGLSALGKWVRAVSERPRCPHRMPSFCVRTNGYAKRTAYSGRRGRC